MSMDPDDQYFDYTIEKAYENSINYSVDVLEFEISVKHRYGRRYKISAYSHNIHNITELKIKMQKFDYEKTNWNIINKIYKRQIYEKGINLFLPFLKDKKIWYAEDLLHVSSIYLFASNYMCMNYIGYFYYRGNTDSAENNKSKDQKDLQFNLVKLLASYFFSKRNNLSNCSLSDFLSNKAHLDCYNGVTNLEKTATLNCTNCIDGFKISENKEFGYCKIVYKS